MSNKGLGILPEPEEKWSRWVLGIWREEFKSTVEYMEQKEEISRDAAIMIVLACTIAGLGSIIKRTRLEALHHPIVDTAHDILKTLKGILEDKRDKPWSGP